VKLSNLYPVDQAFFILFLGGLVHISNRQLFWGRRLIKRRVQLSRENQQVWYKPAVREDCPEKNLVNSLVFMELVGLKQPTYAHTDHFTKRFQGSIAYTRINCFVV